MDRVKVLPNERVGISDFEADGKLAQENHQRNVRGLFLPTGRTTGAAQTSARVLSGFAWDAISGGVDDTAVLNRGVAILPVLDDSGNVTWGLLFGEHGDASKLVDFTTAPATSVQAVYIRATSTAASFENRVFWNPTSAAEFIDNVSTRQIGTWAVTFQDEAAPPPGSGEWVKIYEITINGAGKISAVEDFRHLYFEGSARDAYDHEWGDGTNDRDDARKDYGIGDLHMWTQMVRRQLADVIGLPAGGPHLAHRQPPIELQSLLIGHYGEADAPVWTDRGKHKDFQFGDDQRWWLQESLGADPTISQELRWTGQGGPDPAVRKLFGVSGDASAEYIEPRGVLTALNNGHVHLKVVGTDFIEKLELVNAALGEREFTCPNTGSARYLKLRLGPGARPGAGTLYQVNEGLVFDGTEGGYQLSERQVAMLIDLGMLTNGGAWVLNAAGVDLSSNALVLECAAGSTSQQQMLSTIDFPEGARLDYVDVIWYQSAGGGGVDMRLYVARQTLAIDEVAETAGAGVSTIALNAAQQYIEIATTATYVVERFTANVNNTDWSRAKDRLVMALVSSDSAAPTHRVVAIRPVWTFSNVTAFPLASVHT